MPHSTYAELNEQMSLHFQNKEYQQALDLILGVGPNFPAERILVDYWAMCSAARLDNRFLVYQIAEQFHADGLWYGEVMWRQTPSFQKLQGEEDFERLVAASKKAMESDPTASQSVSLKYLPANHSSKSPLLIALHGNQYKASDTVPFWQPAVLQGYVLAVPQSTQAAYKGAYVWDELETAFADVKKCYAEIQADTAFDENHVVLAGHSMGALIAIHMALTGMLNLRGFVVNGAAIPFREAQDELEALLPLACDRGLRGYFIVGENDLDISQEEIRWFFGILKSAGLVCELEAIPGATHDYNPAYDAALVRALEFVNS